MGSGKGGSSPSATQVVTKETTMPEYAAPYFEELLGRTAYEATRPYEAYGGQRIADFDPQERAAMRGMTEMAAAGTPYQLQAASDIGTLSAYPRFP